MATDAVHGEHAVPGGAGPVDAPGRAGGDEGRQIARDAGGLRSAGHHLVAHPAGVAGLHHGGRGGRRDARVRRRGRRGDPAEDHGAGEQDVANAQRGRRSRVVHHRSRHADRQRQRLGRHGAALGAGPGGRHPGLRARRPVRHRAGAHGGGRAEGWRDGLPEHAQDGRSAGVRLELYLRVLASAGVQDARGRGPGLVQGLPVHRGQRAGRVHDPA